MKRKKLSIYIREDCIMGAKEKARQEHRSLNNYIEKLIAEDALKEGSAIATNDK